MVAFSHRFDAALSFAAVAHRGQVRKGSRHPAIPYIVHPVQVANILAAHGFGEDLVIAGLLHDTVEDCEVSLTTIAAEFGEHVAELVDAVSEQKAEDDGAKRPWKVRKQEQLDHLAGASAEVAALKAADALHNVSCTAKELERDGPSVWNRFSASPEDSVWYYRQIVELCRGVLGEHALLKELEAAVDALI